MYLERAVLVAFAAASCFQPALRLPRRGRTLLLLMSCALILLAPLMVPGDRPFPRMLAAVWAVALTAKLWDLHLGAELGSRPGLGAYAAYLVNLALVVWRKRTLEPRPGVRADAARLALGLVAGALGVALEVVVYQRDWRLAPFLVEHGVKVAGLFAVVLPIAQAGAAFYRLLGLPAREPMRNPLAACTPADFWVRYNRPAQQFFYEDVFKPLGGMHSPLRATLGTFVVSGLVHEYLFDLAAGRIQGYQMVFFLIQGLATGATMGINPRGWRRRVWVAGTLAFNLATSAVFFASLNEIVPFYARR